VDKLQGIDLVSKDKLEEAGVKTIYDLSQAAASEKKITIRFHDP